MASIKLETLNKGKKFPKLVVRRKEEELKGTFKLIGGVTLPSGADKIVLEGYDHESRILCSFETLKEKYKIVGTYGEEKEKTTD